MQNGLIDSLAPPPGWSRLIAVDLTRGYAWRGWRRIPRAGCRGWWRRVAWAPCRRGWRRIPRRGGRRGWRRVAWAAQRNTHGRASFRKLTKEVSGCMSTRPGGGDGPVGR